MLNNLGFLASKRGDLDEAESLHHRSLQLAKDIGLRSTEAAALYNLGIVASKRSELESAEQFCLESLAIRREIGERDTEQLP